MGDLRAWLDDEGDSAALWTLLTRDPDEHFRDEGIPLWPMEEDEATRWVQAVRDEARLVSSRSRRAFTEHATPSEPSLLRYRRHQDCPDANVRHSEPPADMDDDGHSPTREQVRCPTCGFYSVWRKRTSEDPSRG